MNDEDNERPLNRATKLLIILIVWGCMALAWFVWYCNNITEKAYNRGLNEIPANMQRVINQTKQSDSITIDYFNRTATEQERSIARGFLVYLKSVKELAVKK